MNVINERSLFYQAPKQKGEATEHYATRIHRISL